MRLPYWAWYALWLLGCTVGVATRQANAHGALNGWQVILAFFVAVNLITCLHKICLGHPRQGSRPGTTR